jgi:hypothetical protein
MSELTRQKNAKQLAEKRSGERKRAKLTTKDIPGSR